MTTNYDTIHCSFCKNVLRSSAKDKNYTRIFTDYDCEGCQAEFVVDEDSQQIVSYSLADGDFRLEFNLLNGTCEIQRAYSPSYINKGPTYHHNWRPILSLPLIPDNVTPRNVGNKIRTFLLFS